MAITSIDLSAQDAVVAEGRNVDGYIESLRPNDWVVIGYNAYEIIGIVTTLPTRVPADAEAGYWHIGVALFRATGIAPNGLDDVPQALSIAFLAPSG